MTTVAVGDELKEDRAIAAEDPILRVADGLQDSENIHTVRLLRYQMSDREIVYKLRSQHLNTRDLVTTSEVLGVGRTALCRSTHSVLVVLADEDTRQVPEFGLHDGFRPEQGRQE